MRKRTFAHVMSWVEEEGTATYVGGAANRVVSSPACVLVRLRASSRPLRHGRKRRLLTDLSIPYSSSFRLAMTQNATHPLFNLTMTHSDAMLAYFYGQSPPSRYQQQPSKK